MALAFAVVLPAQASASMDCGNHALHRTAQATTPDQATGAWESIPLAGDECPHCLPRHCAAAPACGASLVSVLATSVRSDVSVPQSLGIPSPDSRVPPGLDTPPPTPPPQISA